MSALVRNNVRTAGTGPTAIVFAPGVGCDRNMGRHVAPAFEVGLRTLLCGPVNCPTRAGDADDRGEIGRELGLQDAVPEPRRAGRRRRGDVQPCPIP